MPRYPAGWRVHRVKSAGHILVARKVYGIGRAFDGLPVGLKPLTDTLHAVYFGPLLLGQLDLQQDRFIRLLPKSSP
jgi:hypothetical protein